MIAGEIIAFRNIEDSPYLNQDALIELTEWDSKIEIAIDLDGKRRVFIKFRLEDLVREVKEARDQ